MQILDKRFVQLLGKFEQRYIDRRRKQANSLEVDVSGRSFAFLQLSGPRRDYPR